MEDKQLQVGDTALQVSPGDGELNDGALLVETVHVEGVHVDLENLIHWDDDSTLAERLRQTFMGQEDWPDTMELKWTEPRIVEPGTQLWCALSYIAHEYPVTTDDIREDCDLNGNTQNVVYKLKQKNVVADIGKDGQHHLTVPTHLGIKELFNANELDNNSKGLQELFGEESVKEQDGEEPESDPSKAV